MNWENGTLYIKTPHGNHSVPCVEDEARFHVKRIIEGIARDHGYGTIAVDMAGELDEPS